MAAGEKNSGTLRCYLRQAIASITPEKNISSLLENSADHSDACSDSGSEYNENSRNVVQWLQSLPVNNQWCEAEEQIGRPDSSEALVDGISSIGDSDAPIILKSRANSRAESSNVKKVCKDKKYRRGALHANSTPKELSKSSKQSTISGAKSAASGKSLNSCEKIGSPKKSIIASEKSGITKKAIITCEKNGASKKSINLSQKKTLSKKSKKSTIATEITEIIGDLENENVDSARIQIMDYRPVFDNPDFGKMLDDKMSLAINSYKRNERTWTAPTSSNFSIANYEPPNKKSKVFYSQFSPNFNIKNNGMD